MLRLRIERSKALLTDSRLSVLDVALEVVFRNQQHSQQSLETLWASRLTFIAVNYSPDQRLLYRWV